MTRILRLLIMFVLLPGLGLAAEAPLLAWRLVAEYPHNPASFSQGLLFDGEALYESVGQFGRSALLKLDLSSGRELKRLNLGAEHFAEGLALVRDKLYQLTWNSHKIFVYEKDGFKLLGEYPLPGEGWGLAFDGTRLIVSDGTSTLRLLRPGDLTQTGKLEVKNAGSPLKLLNELEYVDGLLYANVWHSDKVAVIAPKNGEVVAWLDFSMLKQKLGPLDQESVLNGIAFNPQNRHFYVTGKNWPRLFEVELSKSPDKEGR